MIHTQAELIAALGSGATELELNALEPLTLSGVKKQLTLTGRIALSSGIADSTPALALANCDDVALDSLQLLGASKPDGGFAGRGLLVQGGTGLSVKGCELAQLNQGAVLIGCAGTIVVGCDLHDIQVDGLQVQQAKDLTIEANWFRRFRPLPGNHPDAVQFLSNAAATDDVDGATIRANLIDVFPEDNVQGIFLMDPRFGGHRRCVVEDNLIFSTSWWGLGVNGCKDPIVRRNRLFQLIGAPYVPRINTGGVPVTLEGNEAPGFVFKAVGDPLPPGNVVNKPIDAASFDALRVQWLAQHRDQLKAERDKLMAQMETALTAANDTFGKLRALG